jgi:DMSO/TMAO reductase YedYZ molybdopterin-dependent catalytic subunit
MVMEKSMNRRKFIQVAAVSVGGLTLPLRSLPAENDIPKEILKPVSMITPNDKFYVLQIGEVPTLKSEHWRMGITGLVEKLIMLNYEDITSMESVTTMRTLKCIGDPIGAEQMSNAMWTGVPLRNILDKAGIKEQAKVVVFRCADRYHTAIPIDRALREEVLLVYKMNGELLPADHGFPVRLLNPGHYGTKNPKWIMNIMLAKSHVGYWEEEGWDPVARVKLATVIGTPSTDETIQAGGTYTISGAAFDSGNHGGITRVEVSIDDGITTSVDDVNTWEATETWGSDSPLAWYLWKYRWQVPDNPGEVEISARAIANDGLTQKESGFDADPAGAVGYHFVRAEIVKG